MTPPGVRLADAVRAARPLLAGQAVVLGAGVVLRPALLFVLAPHDLAEFGLLNEALRWAVVVGGMGLATGVLRIAPERPHAVGGLVRRACLAVLLMSCLAFAGLRLAGSWVLGDGAALREFATFGWRIPCIALTAVAVASLHAAGRLRAKAVLTSLDSVLVFAGAFVGALLDGLSGLVTGTLIGSAVATFAATRTAFTVAGPSTTSAPGLLRAALTVGRFSVVLMLVETLRRFAVLRVASEAGLDGAALGHLYAAIAVTLPLIAVPEMVAQAAYPKMLGPDGESGGLDATHRGLLRGLALWGVPLLVLHGIALALLLPLIRDGDYAAAVAPAIALLPGVAAHGLTAHTGYVVLVRDRLAHAIVVALVALTTAATCTWLLTPVWGATGAAAGLSAALIVRGVALVAVASRARRPA